MRPAYSKKDLDHGPLVVFYELTRACDLVCRHCRASAQPSADPRELGPEQSIALIDQLAEFDKPPLLVLTGGDPMKRADVYELVARARERRLEVAMTPSATFLVTGGALQRLQHAGLRRLAVSIDGAGPATHDVFRGQPGSFVRTTEIMADARALGLPLQVNTTVTRYNVDELDTLADWLADQAITLWSVFFLVPVGRAGYDDRITPQLYEHVFERLLAHADRQPYAIKTTEAPHYRRYLLQRRRFGRYDGARANGANGANGWSAAARTIGTNDGKGVMFVSHTGEIYPSGFLPLRCGRFPQSSVLEVYRRSPVFLALREPDGFDGKCGTCEFRRVCGGSRARAYAVTGNAFASEPDCVYEPAAASRF